MTDNPYAAPKAPVSDIEPEGAPLERPKQVKWAIWILVLNWVFGFTIVVANWSYYKQLQAVGSTIFGQVLGVAIGVWIYYKIWQGRNWARIVLLVFTILGVAGWAVIRMTGITTNAPAMIRASSIIGLGMGVAVLWLLFLSPGKEWFRRRD